MTFGSAWDCPNPFSCSSVVLPMLYPRNKQTKLGLDALLSMSFSFFYCSGVNIEVFCPTSTHYFPFTAQFTAQSMDGFHPIFFSTRGNRDPQPDALTSLVERAPERYNRFKNPSTSSSRTGFCLSKSLRKWP